MTTNLRLSLVLCGTLGSACTKYYQPPAVPDSQLAVASIDSRAKVLTIDGLAIKPKRGTPRLFLIGTGCRAVTVKYEESFFSWGDKRAMKKGLGTGLEVAIAETEIHDYETTKPIRFFVPARAGHTYWVTATFTGDEFIPRVVEVAPDGTSIGKFLPDRPCQ
jgi:hypothetical protein